VVYRSLFIIYTYKISFHVSNIFVLLKYLTPPFSLDYLDPRVGLSKLACPSTRLTSIALALMQIPVCTCGPKNLKMKVKSLSRFRVFVTPWTVACQPLPSMIFSRQEYWSVLPFPSPGDPDPGIEPRSSAL